VPPNLVILLTGRSAYHGLPVRIIRVPVSILPRLSADYGSPVRVARFGYSSQTGGAQQVRCDIAGNLGVNGFV
jgi:hypothetical protein